MSHAIDALPCKGLFHGSIPTGDPNMAGRIRYAIERRRAAVACCAAVLAAVSTGCGASAAEAAAPTTVGPADEALFGDDESTPAERRARDRSDQACRSERGSRKVTNQEALLQELADILAWLSAFRGSGEDVSIRSWCEWNIETEEGVRASAPTTKPPPAHDLPNVSNLVGVTRDRILSEFAEPFAGCWLDRAVPFPRRLAPACFSCRISSMTVRPLQVEAMN